MPIEPTDSIREIIPDPILGDPILEDSVVRVRAISLLEPMIMEAIPERIANKYWLYSLKINSPQVNGPTTAIARLVPYNEETGEMFMSQIKVVRIDDLLDKASVDTDLALCINSLFVQIDKYAQRQGDI